MKIYYFCPAGPAVTLHAELLVIAEWAKALKILRDRTLSNSND